MKYHSTLSRGRTNKKAIMIIDESDERIYKDLNEFYLKTKSEIVFTICLTATPFEGDETGLHFNVLDELGYKVYRNSSKSTDFKPIIHETYDIGSLEAYRTLILKESEKCGVLIYANGKEYESLKEESNVIPFTSEKSHLSIEIMDVKVDSRYPVYLINKDYGCRGFNFRAEKSKHGITMLILGTFPDRITAT